jgi:anti-anti-sigma factor
MAPIESLSVTVCHRCLLGPPRCDGPGVVVWLRGEHDLSTAPVLSEAMAWVVALDADVVADLSEVQFMSAATVGVLIRARELLRARSRTFVVRSPSDWARLALELCAATDLLDHLEATAQTGTAGALAKRLPVPTTDRVDHHAGTPASEPAAAPAPLSVGHLTAARLSSVGVEDRADERAADVTGVGAP